MFFATRQGEEFRPARPGGRGSTELPAWKLAHSRTSNLAGVRHINEAPRREGRRGANERLLGWGAWVGARPGHNGRGTYLFRLVGSYSGSTFICPRLRKVRENAIGSSSCSVRGLRRRSGVRGALSAGWKGRAFLFRSGANHAPLVEVTPARRRRRSPPSEHSSGRGPT